MNYQKRFLAGAGILLLGFGFIYYYTSHNQFDQSKNLPVVASSTAGY